jgi:hypothetical protein
MRFITILLIIKGDHTMKQYIVRMIDFDGNIVDGLIVEASNEAEARSLYIIRHYTAFADMYPTDKIVIEEYEGE